MTLVEAIKNIQYDPSWGIWADVPFSAESAARYGQPQFENGGLLDSKVFFADGVQCGDRLAEWLYGIDDPEDWQVEEGAQEMISEVEADREMDEDAI